MSWLNTRTRTAKALLLHMFVVELSDTIKPAVGPVSHCIPTLQICAELWQCSTASMTQFSPQTIATMVVHVSPPQPALASQPSCSYSRAYHNSKQVAYFEAGCKNRTTVSTTQAASAVGLEVPVNDTGRLMHHLDPACTLLLSSILSQL